MDEESKQRAIKGRDLFNENVTPLREDYPGILKVQDVMNRDINKIIYPAPPPPPPPEPDYPDKVPILHLQGGWFNSYKLFQDDVLAREFLHEARMAGYSLHDSFAWLSNRNPDHRNLRYLTPFYWDGNSFHLDKKNPEYWELFRKALLMHKEVGLDFMIQLWMRRDYMNYPYQQNVNGVTDFWDKKAKPFHKLYVEWTMEDYQAVYGEEYNPWVKAINEVAHKGSGRKYHQIMYLHEWLWELLSDYTVLWKFVIDQTGCEGGAAELWQPHICSKQGACNRKAELRVTRVRQKTLRFYDEEKDYFYNVNREKYPNISVGDTILLGRHGDKEYNRKQGTSCTGEFHKYATWTDYKLKKRPTNMRRRRTEDGGGRAGDGKYIVRDHFHLADGDQSEYLGRKLGQYHKDTGAFPYHGHFIHEILTREPDGLFVPIATYERVKPTFDRAKRFAVGYWDIHSS